jgi:lipoyl(octanoyl) transferase
MTGVWLGDEKVCAMGVRVDHWVTSHGFALNVAADLAHFDLIVPCGIRSHGVTSIERATGAPQDLADVARGAGETLAETFGWSMETGDARGLTRPDASPERVLGGVRQLVPGPGE